MDDDFSTPQAIAALFDLAREINRGNDEGLHIGVALKTFRELAGVLGLTLHSELIEPEIPLNLVLELAAETQRGLERKQGYYQHY